MTTDLPTAHIDINALQGATRLADWGVIKAEGEDAKSFLHSQLTQDTLNMDTGYARLAGFCSAKGRLQASFVVWCTAPDVLYLACSADLLAPVLKRLSMFVLRAKCKLSDASAQTTLWGLAGERALTVISNATSLPALWSSSTSLQGTCIRLPDARVNSLRLPRALWVLDAAAAEPDLPRLDQAAWRWLEVKSGVARVTADTVEQFVPQMINLEIVGGVNFQKGCFPGQEVIARSQYRGTVKRRAFVMNSVEAAHAGQEVFSLLDTTQPAGMVVLAGSFEGRHNALVELKLSALQGDSLRLGSATGGQLSLDEMPYTIPTEAT